MEKINRRVREEFYGNKKTGTKWYARQEENNNIARSGSYLYISFYCIGNFVGNEYDENKAAAAPAVVWRLAYGFLMINGFDYTFSAVHGILV